MTLPLVGPLLDNKILILIIGNKFFLKPTNKETAKDECVITFLDNFIFSGCHPWKT